ncbi:TetR/AcrR family transcriptional regulator [Paenibacillus macerans]|uniref:TetR/AcrR family transcriptional regulator n=1 Tax=Paenibacillus macerans TaxID=44252 RepID=UPI003D31CC9F
MNSSEQTTKEKILATALNMFSVNGYTAVSIRDIGRVVGIKESSIYYHFKNKEDILQTLLQQAERWALDMKAGFNQALSASIEVDGLKFIASGISYIEKYLLDEKIYKLIRMLTIENQVSDAAAEMYHQLLFTDPLEHQKKVFASLMERGFIRRDNQADLASEYQSIILFVFLRYFSGPVSATPEAKSAAKTELTSLLRRFYNRYFDREVRAHENL